MIVHRYIEIHLKGYEIWIILMELRVLLIMHYLIQKMLVEVVLDIHIRGVKIKKVFRSKCCNNVFSTKKKVHGELFRQI